MAIIVLNWNGWQDTVECLESLFQTSYPRLTVIVCDNGSTDQSFERLQAWADGRVRLPSKLPGRDPESAASKPLTYICLSRAAPEHWGHAEVPSFGLVLIQNGDNLGFARGYNVGLRYAWAVDSFEFVCVLNNDVVVEPNFVVGMVQAMRNLEPGVAVIGPKVLAYADGSDWQRPERYRPSVWTWMLRGFAWRRARRGTWSWLYRKLWYTEDTAGPVYLLPGSCLFFRAREVRGIGGFDEGTFFYWEEGILAEKLRARRLKAYYVPEVTIYHKWGQSIRDTGLPHFIRSAVYYFRDHRRVGPVSILVLKLLLLLVVLGRVLKGERRHRWSRLAGLLDVTLRA